MNLKLYRNLTAKYITYTLW